MKLAIETVKLAVKLAIDRLRIQMTPWKNLFQFSQDDSPDHPQRNFLHILTIIVLDSICIARNYYNRIQREELE